MLTGGQPSAFCSQAQAAPSEPCVLPPSTEPGCLWALSVCGVNKLCVELGNLVWNARGSVLDGFKPVRLLSDCLMPLPTQYFLSKFLHAYKLNPITTQLPVHLGVKAKARDRCWAVLSRSVRLCDPMDCSLPGSSVHGDSPGKNTGVDCRAHSQPWDWTALQADSLPSEPPGKPNTGATRAQSSMWYSTSGQAACGLSGRVPLPI